MLPSLPRLTVVAGLIQRDGALLICQRRGDGAFPLQWEFPGGKVESGETYTDALRRELREELGIESEIGAALYRTRHDYPGRYAVELLFYHVHTFHGVVRNLAFEQMCWAEPARLSDFDFLDGDAELIALLRQGALLLPQSQP